MTEKRWATIVAVTATLIVMIVAFLSNYSVWQNEPSSTNRLLYALEGTLWIWIPFVISWVPYVFVRAAAVTGGVLASFGLMMTLMLIDDTGGWLLVIYIFWAMGAGLAALYPAFAKPRFFVQSAKRAFWLSAVFTLAVGFGVGFLVSRFV